jgi:hypothetical protein
MGKSCSMHETYEKLKKNGRTTLREGVLGSPRRRWEDNIRTGEVVNWIHLVQDKDSGGLLLTR